MAGYVAEIRVLFDLSGASGKKGTDAPAAAGGGGTGASAAGTGKVLDEVRAEFKELASHVKAVSDAMKGLAKLMAGTKSVAGGQKARPGDDGGEAKDTGKAEASEREAAAAKKSADETKKAATTMETEAKAAKEMAGSLKDLAEETKEIEAELKRSAKASEGATEAEKRRAKAIAVLAAAGPTRTSGKLSPVAKFEALFKDIANDPGIIKAAGEAEQSLAGMLKFGPKVRPEVEKEARAMEAHLKHQVRKALKAVGSAEGVTPDTFRKLQEQLSKTWRDFQRGFDTAGVSFKPGEVVQKVVAKHLRQTSNRVETEFQALGKALEDGAEDFDTGRIIGNIEGFITEMERVFAKEPRRLFSKGAGQEAHPGAMAQLGGLKREIDIAEPRMKLTSESEHARQVILQSAKANRGVAESVRDMIRALTEGDKGLDRFDDNLVHLKDDLKVVNRSFFKTRQEFLKFQEIEKVFRAIRREAGTGALKVPAGATTAEASSVFAGAQLEAARARLFAPGRRAGQKEVVEFKTTDAEGRIKKVRTELYRLGDTMDKVKIKAKDAADNMFDRTSVRAALQRVATWGAAAGVIYGSVNAFRRALGTITDTESKVISLAKVMDESSKGLEDFGKRATDAAIKIAQEFGQPLSEVLDTMILFGQQGKTLAESVELAGASALAANVTVLDQTTAANALTAATQQFGLAASDAYAIVDKFNEVSNNAAVTEQVLAESLKKAGLAARNSGVSLDELNGIIAAISEQTRQSGQQIGTALRFIFSRLTTPEAEQGLAQVGVAARDAQGNFRGFMPIVNELAKAFENLTQSQKTQVAIAVSGTRRFNTFLALLNNFSEFQDSTANSVNSAGSALREQEKVMTTAAFKIQQLRNSLAGLAVSLGGPLLSPLKVLIKGLKTMVDLLSSLHPAIVTAVAGLGLGSLAFIKFGEQLVNMSGLGTAFVGLGASLRDNLTKGVHAANLPQVLGAEFEAVKKLRPDIFVGRQVADIGAIGLAGSVFAKGAKPASEFKNALAGVNRELVTMSGKQVKNAATMSKFGSVVRGYGTRVMKGFGDQALVTGVAVTSLNSGLTRFKAYIGSLSGKIIRFARLEFLFTGLDRVLTGLLGTLGTGIGTVARFVGGFALLGGAIYGILKLKDAVTSTGQSMAKQYSEEIAKRQEAVRQIESQIGAVRKLGAERDKVARIIAREQAVDTPGQEALRDERIRRGVYKSPLLSQQRLREQEFATAQEVGLANPQLIASIDELGNVALKSADAFDSMAKSAVNAQASLLALTQVKAAEALASELKPAQGVKKFVGGLVRDIRILSWAYNKLGGDAKTLGKTQIQVFKESKAEFEEMLQDQRALAAGALNIDIALIDKDFAKDLDTKAGQFQAFSDQIKLTVKAVRDQISKLPADAGDLAISAITREGSNIREALELMAKNASVIQERQVTLREVVTQLFLQNRRPIREGGVGDLIGLNAEETVEKFHERGVVAQALDARKNLADQLQEGDLVLFPNVEGVSQQGIVEVTASGRLMVRSIGDTLQQEAVPLKDIMAEAADQTAEAFKLSPRVIANQINQNLLEVGRIIEGVGRGGLLKKDLELGAKFRFDLTAQQRVAFSDEELFSGIIVAEQNLKRFMDGIGASAQGLREQGAKALSPDVVKQFKELADGIDRLKVVALVKTEIEEAAKAFEQAAHDIEQSGIKEAIKAEFSGFFGAQQGLVQRQFEAPKLEEELTPQQLVDKIVGPEFALLANALAASEQALGDFVAGLELAERNTEMFLHEFESAREAGAVLDPRRISAMAEAALRRTETGVSRGNAIQIGIAENQLSETQKQTQILSQLLAAQAKSPLLMGSALRQAAEAAARGSESDRELFRETVGKIESEKFQGMSKTDLASILRLAPEAGGGAAREAFTARAARDVLADLGTEMAANFRASLEEREAPEETEVKTEAIGAADAALRGTKEVLERSLLPLVSNALARSGGATALSAEGRKEVLTEVISGMEALAEETPKWKEAFDFWISSLREELDTGGGRLTSILEQSISKQIDRGTFRLPERLSEKEKTDPRAETEAARKRAEATKATIRANKDLYQSLKNVISAFDTLSTSVAGLRQELVSSLREAFENIQVEDAMREFTTPVFGALEGVEVPQVDLGKRFKELTAPELTALESPGLSRGLSDANKAFQGMVSSLELVKRKEIEVSRLRDMYLGQGNIKGARQAEEALRQLGSVAEHVRGQASNARDSLKRFGDAFSEIEVVNQLRVDVEKLFESFRNQQKLMYDRTSIETALGRGPFAFIRPTFEQFEQGQRGFMTKFERAVAGIDFRLQQGEITPEVARREKRKAGFERDEEIIAFAQQRENKAFESQIGTAEQIRSRLLTFMEQGGTGAGVARTLFDQLTSELERAGDILPTQGFGQEQIRDPRTGRMVDIPASQVMQFRGVPNLKSVVDQVGQLAQQVQKEQAQQQADLITQPLLMVLDQIPGKLDDIVRVLQLEDPKEERSQLGALDKYFVAVNDLQKGAEAIAGGGPVDAQTLRHFKQAATTLMSLTDAQKRFVLEQARFVGPGGEEVSARGALSQGWRRTETGEPQDLIRIMNEVFRAGGQKELTELRTMEELDQAAKESATSVGGLGSAAADSQAALNASTKALRAHTKATEASTVALQEAAGDTPPTASPTKKAQGGLISGPGGPREDRVPIMASPGEYVINAAAASKIGLSSLDALNRLGLGGRAPRRRGNRFQDGGSIDVEALLADPNQQALNVWAKEAAKQGDIRGAYRLFKESLNRGHLSTKSSTWKEARIRMVIGNWQKEYAKQIEAHSEGAFKKQQKEFEKGADEQLNKKGLLFSYVDQNTKQHYTVSPDRKKDLMDPAFGNRIPQSHIDGFVDAADVRRLASKSHGGDYREALESLLAKKDFGQHAKDRRLQQERFAAQQKLSERAQKLAKKQRLQSEDLAVAEQAEAFEKAREERIEELRGKLEGGEGAVYPLAESQVFAALGEDGKISYSSYEDLLNPYDPSSLKKGVKGFVDLTKLSLRPGEDGFQEAVKSKIAAKEAERQKTLTSGQRESEKRREERASAREEELQSLYDDAALLESKTKANTEYVLSSLYDPLRKKVDLFNTDEGRYALRKNYFANEGIARTLGVEAEQLDMFIRGGSFFRPYLESLHTGVKAVAPWSLWGSGDITWDFSDPSGETRQKEYRTGDQAYYRGTWGAEKHGQDIERATIPVPPSEFSGFDDVYFPTDSFISALRFSSSTFGREKIYNALNVAKSIADSSHSAAGTVEAFGRELGVSPDNTTLRAASAIANLPGYGIRTIESIGDPLAEMAAAMYRSGDSDDVYAEQVRQGKWGGIDRTFRDVTTGSDRWGGLSATGTLGVIGKLGDIKHEHLVDAGVGAIESIDKTFDTLSIVGDSSASEGARWEALAKSRDVTGEILAAVATGGASLTSTKTAAWLAKKAGESLTKRGLRRTGRYFTGRGNKVLARRFQETLEQQAKKKAKLPKELRYAAERGALSAGKKADEVAAIMRKQGVGQDVAEGVWHRLQWQAVDADKALWRSVPRKAAAAADVADVGDIVGRSGGKIIEGATFPSVVAPSGIRKHISGVFGAFRRAGTDFSPDELRYIDGSSDAMARHLADSSGSLQGFKYPSAGPTDIRTANRIYKEAKRKAKTFRQEKAAATKAAKAADDAAKRGTDDSARAVADEAPAAQQEGVVEDLLEGPITRKKAAKQGWRATKAGIRGYLGSQYLTFMSAPYGFAAGVFAPSLLKHGYRAGAGLFKAGRARRAAGKGVLPSFRELPGIAGRGIKGGLGMLAEGASARLRALTLPSRTTRATFGALAGDIFGGLPGAALGGAGAAFLPELLYNSARRLTGFLKGTGVPTKEGIFSRFFGRKKPRGEGSGPGELPPPGGGAPGAGPPRAGPGEILEGATFPDAVPGIPRTSRVGSGAEVLEGASWQKQASAHRAAVRSMEKTEAKRVVREVDRAKEGQAKQAAQQRRDTAAGYVTKRSREEILAEAAEGHLAAGRPIPDKLAENMRLLGLEVPGARTRLPVRGGRPFQETLESRGAFKRKQAQARLEAETRKKEVAAARSAKAQEASAREVRRRAEAAGSGREVQRRLNEAERRRVEAAARREEAARAAAVEEAYLQERAKAGAYADELKAGPRLTLGDKEGVASLMAKTKQAAARVEGIPPARVPAAARPRGKGVPRGVKAVGGDVAAWDKKISEAKARIAQEERLAQARDPEALARAATKRLEAKQGGGPAAVSGDLRLAYEDFAAGEVVAGTKKLQGALYEPEHFSRRYTFADELTILPPESPNIAQLVPGKQPGVAFLDAMEETIEGVRREAQAALEGRGKSAEYLSVFAHEGGHGFGPTGARGYVRGGIPVEEGTTVITQRLAMARRGIPESAQGPIPYLEEYIQPTLTTIEDVLSTNIARAEKIYQEASVGFKRTGVAAVTGEEVTEIFARNVEAAAGSKLVAKAGGSEKVRSALRSKLADIQASVEIDSWIEDALALPKFASGGKISGPGGPRSDRVPILASSGEFVLSAAAVNKIGLPLVDLMNRTGAVPKFAAGGLVGGGVEQIISVITAALRQGFAGGKLGTSAGGGGFGSPYAASPYAASPFVSSATGRGKASQVEAGYQQAKREGFVRSVQVTPGVMEALNVETSGDTPWLANQKELAKAQLLMDVYDEKARAAQESYATYMSPFDRAQLELDIAEGAEVDVGREARRRREAQRAQAAQLGRAAQRSEFRPVIPRDVEDVRLEQGSGYTPLFDRKSQKLKIAGKTVELDPLPFEREYRDDLLPHSGDPNYEEEMRRRGFPGGAVSTYAFGGMIRGPGGPHSDRVPILASSGEFIMNNAAVSNIGLPILQHLNSGAPLPRFENGGYLGNGSSRGLAVEVDTEAIRVAIEEAIASALSNNSVLVDAGTAADVIGTAITAAFIDLELPAVSLETTKVSLDTETVTLDTSALDGLNLGGGGNGVGAATTEEMRRLEERTSRLEGSFEATQENSNLAFDAVERLANIEGSVEELGLIQDQFKTDIGDLQALADDFATLPDTVNSLESKTELLARSNDGFDTAVEELKIIQGTLKTDIGDLQAAADDVEPDSSSFDDRAAALEAEVASLKLAQDNIPNTITDIVTYEISKTQSGDTTAADATFNLEKGLVSLRKDIREAMQRAQEAMQVAQHGFRPR